MLAIKTMGRLTYAPSARFGFSRLLKASVITSLLAGVKIGLAIKRADAHQ